MKRFLASALLVIVFFTNTKANPNYSDYVPPTLLPDHLTGQFAGNIGFVSAGFGYSLRNGKVTSDILLGYVPPQIGKKTIVTIAQKNTIKGRRFKQQMFNRIYPSAAMSINIETGRNSFLKLPDRYPKGYYSTNAVTFGLFAGLNYVGKYRSNAIFSQIEYFAEVGTLASYIYYNIKREEYFNPDILSLALGVKINIKK